MSRIYRINQSDSGALLTNGFTKVIRQTENASGKLHLSLDHSQQSSIILQISLFGFQIKRPGNHVEPCRMLRFQGLVWASTRIGE